MTANRLRRLGDIAVIVIASALVYAALAVHRGSITISDSAATAAPYTFTLTEYGIPATWPCNTTIVVGAALDEVDDALRAGVRADLAASISVIESVSAHRFLLVDGGSNYPTAEFGNLVRRGGVPYQLLFTVGARRDDDLLNDTAAASGGSFTSNGAPTTIHAGYVHVDIEHLPTYRPGSGLQSRQALFTHELLHTLNLGHVAHPAHAVGTVESLMTTRVSASTGTIGLGDIAGLRALDEHRCG